MVFLAVFLAPVILVPLLANDAQNLKRLALSLGIEWGAPAKPRDMQGPRLPAKVQPVPPESLLERLTDAAPKAELTESFATLKPKERCDMLRELEAGSAPEFKTNPNGDWECTLLVERQTGKDTLFLHVRGDDLLTRTFRVKLSLLADQDRMSLISLTAHFMNHYLPIDVPYVEGKVNEAIETDDNVSFILGYGEISIRPERNGERRFNVLLKPGFVQDQAGRGKDLTFPLRLPVPPTGGIE